MKRGLLAAATAVVALSLLPLAGVLWGVLDPPENVLAPSLGYSELWVRSDAGWLLLRTLGLAAGVCALAIPVGTGLAWIEQRCEYPGRSLLAVLDLMPLAIPSSAEI